MAKKEFERLMARFPKSKFSFLAEKMVRDCNIRLGEHEFYVGRLYFKMRQYRAAQRRFEEIIKNYANIGLDYKANFFIGETQKKIAEEEARKKVPGQEKSDAPIAPGGILPGQYP
jgi:outer membrane protein assembly factor BamD